MKDDKSTLERLMDDLARMRDELKLKSHLGKAEAKDEWEKLEKKWQHLQGQMKPFSAAAGDTARGVGEALDLAAGELKAGYERFKKLL